jgi:valyl-tRNA synthetase
LKATIYFEKEVTKEDIALKNKNIENLKASIERRKKLLANENYVAKAPQKLVEEEKNKLKEEEKSLEELLKN